MSDERSRTHDTQAREPDARVDAPVPRALPRPAAAQGPRYSEKQVAQILQRAAQLERGRAAHKPELSLAEVEEIAREAGLDPSLVKIAAQSLEGTEREAGVGARIAGAPMRRVIERVIDAELTAELHERISGELRSALRAEGPRRSPQLSSVGRTLAVSARTGTSVIEIELAPRGSKTLLRIDVNREQMSGALFGGLCGGLGFGMTPAIVAIAASQSLQAPAIALLGAAWLGGVCLLARTLFSRTSHAQYRRMEQLADQLAERIRDELGTAKR